jgi:hypothetical protein
MDPLTILAGLKTGLAAGKTIAGLSKQIGEFFDATDQAKKTLQKKGISSKSSNSIALDRWAKVRQAAEAEARREAIERQELAVTLAGIFFLITASGIGSTAYLHHMGWIDVKDYWPW